MVLRELEDITHAEYTTYVTCAMMMEGPRGIFQVPERAIQIWLMV